MNKKGENRPAATLPHERYLIGTAVFGVGTPAVLMAVTAAECWNTVCDSLVPKYRVPEVPAETGSAAAK